MKRRSSLIAALVTFAVLIAACGVGSTGGATPEPTATVRPTPSPAADLTATCLSTEAYAQEHIVAVIGQDALPTAFDAIKGGSCQVSEPIVQIRVTLTSEHSEQVALIDLPSPVGDFAVPLDGTSAPTLLDTLKPGRYEREVVAIASDGREVEIQGFEPVILVADLNSTLADLLRAQSRWERNSLRAYTYTTSWQCFCLPEYLASVNVEVEGGQVTSIAFADPQFTGEVPDQHRFTTIDGLFQILQEAHDHPAHSIRAEYDEQLGYPVETFIDYEATMADEERGFMVSDLRY